MSDLIKDPPQLILQLMKDTFGSQFNAYFLGSPTMIPEDAYPCCVVQPQTSSNTIQNAPTGHDSVSELITINFLENSKDSLNASDSEETTIRKIYNYVQGRDPVTGWYKANTAMYALRNSLDLGTLAQTGHQTIIDHDFEINYDAAPRQDAPTIVMAIVTIVTRERIPVNRV